MSTVTIKELVPGKYAENAQTTQYTAANCRTIIDKFTGTNVTGGNVTMSVNIVPSAGAADNSNIITITRTLAPKEVYRFPELVGQYLDTGSFISTIAGAATSISIRVSGREIT